MTKKKTGSHNGEVSDSGEKLKLGFYWAASCGGCEIAVLEIGERILDVSEKADILFWPCVMDFKYDDVRAMPEKFLDVVFFNGGIRNSEQQEIAELLREKSKILIAFGACAHLGGIPSLANLYPLDEIFSTVYERNPSLENPQGIFPQHECSVPEGEVHLPVMHNTVKPLDCVVDVDYYIPGCPPHHERIWEGILAIVQNRLPKTGSVIAAGDKSVCDECKLEKREIKIKKFYRPHEIKPEKDWCLLEQGIVCVGQATRSGCEARCIEVNLPCRGCYGPVQGAVDQGAAAISAIGSLIDTGNDAEASEIIDQIVDPAGTFYRFAVGASILRKVRQ